jgi:hypothetical protein
MPQNPGPTLAAVAANSGRISPISREGLDRPGPLYWREQRDRSSPCGMYGLRTPPGPRRMPRIYGDGFATGKAPHLCHLDLGQVMDK